MEVIEQLEAAGIRVLLLKGAALAQSLYSPAEVRGYFDVDLLVALSSLARAREVMRAGSFLNRIEQHGIDNLGQTLHADEWVRLVPDFGSISVDLHWKLPGCAADPDYAWHELTREAGAVELGGRQVPTLGLPGQALHLALHAAQHGRTDLKAMGDLERGLVRWEEEVWRQAAALAAALEGQTLFTAGLHLLPGGAAMAERLGLPGAPSALWLIDNQDRRPRGTFHLEALSDAAGVAAKARVVRAALFPSATWMRWEHPWTRSGRFALAAGYILHLLRAPAWALRAWRFRREARRSAR